MERKVNYKNIQYGMLVEYIYPNQKGSYHTGMKVHFFNHKGVLIGNIYEFVPYDRLRLRQPTRRMYPRYFMNERLEVFKRFLFLKACRVVTFLIKFTQSYMHKI